MKPNWALCLIPIACLAVSACDGKGEAKAPAGQVVATVDGQEITVRDLRAEMGGTNYPDPVARKAAESAAVQSIVSRKLLAKAAEDRDLDKTPDFALLKQRANELALAQALQESILKTVPPATRDEAERYVLAHPDMFSQRKVFVVDQIRTVQPSPQIVDKLRPLKTLDDVKELFAREGVPYDTTTDKIDAVGSDPRIIESIANLGPGEVFALPSGLTLTINRITETRIRPFTGEPAVNFAMRMLTRERSQQTLAREVQAITANAENKIKYNKDYQPAPKAAAPAAKAPPAAPKANGV
jgi:peptidyl-prolyl cis-trans isomerase C